MAWIWAHRVILQFALMLGLMNALGMLVVTVKVLYSQEVLGLGLMQHWLLIIAGAACWAGCATQIVSVVGGIPHHGVGGGDTSPPTSTPCQPNHRARGSVVPIK